MVVQSDSIRFGKAGDGFFSDLFSKHVLDANHERVFFGGEIWFDHSARRIVLNDKSGTYRSDQSHLPEITSLLTQMFPGYEIRSFECNQRFLKEDIDTGIQKMERIFLGGGEPEIILEKMVQEDVRNTLFVLNAYANAVVGLKSPHTVKGRAFFNRLERKLGDYRLNEDLLVDASRLELPDAVRDLLARRARDSKRAFLDYLASENWLDGTRSPLVSYRDVYTQRLIMQKSDQIKWTARAAASGTEEIFRRIQAFTPTEENIHGLRRTLRSLLLKILVSKNEIGFAREVHDFTPIGFSLEPVVASKYNLLGGTNSDAFFSLQRSDYYALIYWIHELGSLKDQLEVTRMISQIAPGMVDASELATRFEKTGIYSVKYRNPQELVDEIKSSGALERIRHDLSASPL